MNAFEEARRKAGLTLREAARKSNISPMTLSSYENDKTSPTLEVIKRLASVYNVGAEFFLQ